MNSHRGNLLHPRKRSISLEKIPKTQTPNLRQNGHPKTTQCTTLSNCDVKIFFAKYNDPVYVKMEKLDIIVKLQEAGNAPFCVSQEKFHAVVLRGVGNVSEAPVKSPYEISCKGIFGPFSPS